MLASELYSTCTCFKIIKLYFTRKPEETNQLLTLFLAHPLGKSDYVSPGSPGVLAIKSPLYCTSSYTCVDPWY